MGIGYLWKDPLKNNNYDKGNESNSTILKYKMEDTETLEEQFTIILGNYK